MRQTSGGLSHLPPGATRPWRRTCHTAPIHMVCCGVCSGFIPHTRHAFPRAPLGVLWMQPDDGATLRPHQILHRNTNRPAESSRHGDDLIRGMDRLRTANTGNGLHVFHRGEQLHANRRGAQSQPAIEVLHQGRPVADCGVVSPRLTCTRGASCPESPGLQHCRLCCLFLPYSFWGRFACRHARVPLIPRFCVAVYRLLFNPT